MSTQPDINEAYKEKWLPSQGILQHEGINPEKDIKEVDVDCLATCLGLIGFPEDNIGLLARHYQRPVVEKVKKTLEDVGGLSYLAVSGLNYTRSELDRYMCRSSHQSFGQEEGIPGTPQEIYKKAESDVGTCFGDLIRGRIEVEKILEAQGLNYDTLWSERPDTTTYMKASIPDNKVRVVHSNPPFKY